MYIFSSLRIDLNSTGFSGRDIDALLPDFMTERKTTVGLTWNSSVNGPESFGIWAVVYAGLAAAAGGFLAEFGADLYKWTKDKLLLVLRTKQHPDCYISIKFDDVEIFYHEDGLFSTDEAGDVLLNFFENISNFILKIDPSVSKVWEISRGDKNGDWKVEPAKDLE